MAHRNPTLYHAASSYYSMVARYALVLSNIDYDSRLLDIHKKREQLNAWYVAINPAMTVPALQVGDQVLGSSTEIVQYAVASRPEQWFESAASLEQQAQIAHLVQLHENFEVERLSFNAFMQKLPPLRLLFPQLLRKICKQLSEQIEQGAPDLEALKAKLALNQSRLEYFTGAPLDVRQSQQIKLAQALVNAFGQAPAGQWLCGDKPSHADVVLVVFLARLKMVGLLDQVQVPRAWVDYLEQKTQTSAFKDADVWVKLQPLRLLSHR
ncbi:MAG TPA: glutathione S-transferase [Orrella sp.]